MARFESYLGFVVLMVVAVGFLSVSFIQTEPKLESPQIFVNSSETITPAMSILSNASQERLDLLFGLLREQVTSLPHVQKCLDFVLDGKTDNEQNGCPTHEFVMTTFDAGGLGNKMSEYATLLAISTLTGFTPVLSEDHYNVLIEVFPSIPFNGSQISKSCMEAAKPLNPGNLPETMAFLATRPQDRIRNIRLNTYPNAVFYYDKVKGILKDHFTFMPKVSEPAEEFLRAVRSQIKSTVSEPVWVGIHVRRTNYKHHLNVTQNGTLVTLDYFERAMVKLKETLEVSNPSFDPSNLVYVVSSDDVPWIKANFRTLAKAETIIYAADAWKGSFEFQPKFLDMCIMSKCNHSIFDYGTFGFWGAYLADGHTVLSHNIGSMENSEVENIKPAKLSNWHFIDAHGA